MSIRFAGSRCVDERRRRRLAQEADGSELSSRPDARERKRSEEGDSKLPRGSSPADTLVSPRLWKHGVVILLSLLAWLGVLMLGRSADLAQNGLEGIVGLRAGKLTTFFSTVMLLAAGQLAFINLWYRSRSRKDFSGSYKLWFYAAVGWLAICALRATGAHWSLADAALAGRPMAIWNCRMIVWLIPAAITLVSLYGLLRREMRDCCESLWTLRLAGAAALANSLVLLFGQFGLSVSGQLLAESGLGMAWHMLLALSMLLHARHVIHVCNEPPHTPIRRWRWSLLIPGWPRRRSARNGKPEKSPTGEKRSTAARSTKSNSKRGTTRRKSVVEDSGVDEADRESAVLTAASDDDEASDTDLEAATAPALVANRTRAAEAPPVSRRVDPPQSAPAAQSKPHFTAPVAMSTAPKSSANDSADDDSTDDAADDDGSGLSKKERRRQKKLQRQQSRTGR